MAVLRPLKVVIENYPEGQVEELDAVNNPEDPAAGTRKVPFSRELWIEREDFMEDPPKKFFRLAPGREVRLRYAYFVTCHEVVKDAAGEIVELRCTYDPATRGGDAPDGRTAQGHAPLGVGRARRPRRGAALRPALQPTRPRRGRRPAGGPQSRVRGGADGARSSSRRWPALAAGETVQFERLGYFCVDPDSRPGQPVFNRT